MITDDIGISLLSGNNLELRNVVQEVLRSDPNITDWPAPVSADMRIQAAAASIAELCASRMGQVSPSWAVGVPALNAPIYVVTAALRMKHLRELCDTESPVALRKRNILAPPNFLEFL